MLQEVINPVVLVVTALFAGFVGKYAARWGLQVYHHLGVLSRGRYLAFYDKFRVRSAFELLSGVSELLPGDYDDYLVLHREGRASAYRVYLGCLVTLLARILLVVGILAGGCFIALGRHHPGWIYFLSVVIALLPTIHSVLNASIKRKHSRKFYRLSVMSLILIRVCGQGVD